MIAMKRSGAILDDKEIREYLEARNWEVDALDAVMDILNTSDQIISAEYDPTSSIMRIVTRENIFSFRWKLKQYKGEFYD